VSDSEQLAFIMRVLRVTALENCDDIWWRTDSEYAPLTIMTNCSDCFWWGSADGDRVTPENIDVFEQAYVDLKAIEKDDCTARCYGTMLFSARLRKMRPQGAAYPENRVLWPLFDACGPERVVERGNPYKPGGRMRNAQLDAFKAADRYREALTEIASYSEGSVVTGSFDCPYHAEIARKALEAK
jgi:hypothetical protein